MQLPVPIIHTQCCIFKIDSLCLVKFFYGVFFCFCFEKQLIPTAKKRIQTIMNQLKMCSVYSLDVFPLYNNSEIKTKTTQLRTKSSVQNPKNVKLSLDSVKDKVNIQWDSVKCANNYKIFQKLSSPASSHSSKGSEWTYLTNKVKARLNSPEPCSLVR